MPVVAAIGALIAAWIAGGILIGLGLTFTGIIVALAALPVALVVWVMWGDRL